MHVVELMTKDPVTVWGETSLADAAGLMDQHHINGLPVLNTANRLIGMITQGDLLRRPELGTDQKHTSWLSEFFLKSRLEDDYVHTHGRHVSEVMTPNPKFVSPESDLAEVAALMTEKRMKSLPVVRDTVLVGVISRSDIIRALAGKLLSLADSSGAEGASDEAIKNAILSNMAREKRMPKPGIRIEVKGGVVNLEGVTLSDSERRMIIVIAENTSRVKQVNDHLVNVDPALGMPLLQQI